MHARYSACPPSRLRLLCFSCSSCALFGLNSQQAYYAPDSQGFYGNDKTSIFIPPSVPYALAVINSQVSWWFSQQIFASRQGGFSEFKPMYFSQIPIPVPTEAQQKSIESVVWDLLWLNRPDSTGGQHPADGINPQMFGYFEQLLNGLVYDLFFPDELHAQKLFLFRCVEEAKLPVLSEIPEAKRLAVLHETFERIYDLNHPIRGCLFSLGSLETVRIIEGEA